ncbi:hypothetical protein HDU83_004693 [Entophlyctis luteolus]|nr:hypothetical protein HDU83_004693 [Entophlyctis luteolus]
MALEWGDLCSTELQDCAHPLSCVANASVPVGGLNNGLCGPAVCANRACAADQSCYAQTCFALNASLSAPCYVYAAYSSDNTAYTDTCDAQFVCNRSGLALGASVCVPRIQDGQPCLYSWQCQINYNCDNTCSSSNENVDSGSTVLKAVVGVLVVLLLSIVAYCCWRYCCKGAPVRPVARPNSAGGAGGGAAEGAGDFQMRGTRSVLVLDYEPLQTGKPAPHVS